ncbi:MAG TPA: NAD(P)-dependent oxidoreductase, partial [Candidatus Saccharimonadales bacterium]|nr:NAD(P)-dependent oxidoreductase [Candidatus Saccharimonadales bacterium]
HAISLMFAVAREITEANQSLRRGEWLDEKFIGTEIDNKNVGLIGHGNVGRKIEHILLGLTKQVKFINSKSNIETIDNLISWADIIFVCASLNERTRHMIDARRLDTLKPGAIIINISRGAIIDENALYNRLKKGDISAGLDVFEQEPSNGKVGEMISQLANLPNVVVTPHIAYNTKESGEKLGREIIENIKACLIGQPINIVS